MAPNPVRSAQSAQSVDPTRLRASALLRCWILPCLTAHHGETVQTAIDRPSADIQRLGEIVVARSLWTVGGDAQGRRLPLPPIGLAATLVVLHTAGDAPPDRPVLLSCRRFRALVVSAIAVRWRLYQ